MVGTYKIINMLSFQIILKSEKSGIPFTDFEVLVLLEILILVCPRTNILTIG
jgi:hypothetical protein